MSTVTPSNKNHLNKMTARASQNPKHNVKHTPKLFTHPIHPSPTLSDTTH